MKFLKALALGLLLAAVPVQAYAALSANTVWEVRTGGNSTNGGGFVVAQGSTDVSNSATLVVDGTDPKIVTSSARNFVAGDVGKYINISAGTNFTQGVYRILSTNSNAATLDRAPAPVSATGGTYTLYAALDYSQQDAKNTTGNNISTTDAVATGSTTITSATGAFTSAIVGNVIYLAGGSNSLTAGRYQVTGYTNSTTITVDRSVASGTGITMNIGGALDSLGTAASVAIGANRVFVKAGSGYSISAGITFPNAVFIQGYTTVRGDQGRATIQAILGSMTMLTLNSQNSRLYNIILDCASQLTCSTLNASYHSTVYNVKLKDFTVTGITTNSSQMHYLEITSAAVNCTSGMVLNGSDSDITHGYFHDMPCTVAVVNGNNQQSFMFNLFRNITGATSDGVNNGNGYFYNNTFHNIGRDAIQLNVVANGGATVAKANIFSTTGGYGIRSNVATPATPLLDGNAFYATTLGAISGINNAQTSSVNWAGPYQYTGNRLLSYDPFVDAAGGDFSLNNTGGGGADLKGNAPFVDRPGLATSTDYRDFGAFQAEATAGGAGGSFVFGQ